MQPQRPSVPLCVDLDGTLIRTDTLWENICSAIGRNPLIAFLVPFWVIAGKAHLKQKAAEYGPVDTETLPYFEPFLQYLRQQHVEGRRLFLVTGCTAPVARSVAAHLRIFEETLATENGVNLTGRQKLRLLTERFGAGQFEYAGNARADLPIWRSSSSAMAVNAPAWVLRKLRRTGVPISLVFPTPGSWMTALVRQLRMHQWVKNLLLFGALLLSHSWNNWAKLGECFQAFLAFNFIASSVYALNDLLDLEADRTHPAKRSRPMASGALPLWMGVLLGPLLAAAGLTLASVVSKAFLGVTAGYLAVAAYYSLYAKRRAILDVMVLSSLYSLRLYAGGIAAQITISPWTVAYTSFLFLSLALLKRYSELIGDTVLSIRRGYERKDAIMIAFLGCASGLIAALPLALYAGSPEARLLYRSPQMLWLLCAVHVYWVSRIWVLAHRGLVWDDPVLFAIRDHTTYWLGACSAVILYFAI